MNNAKFYEMLADPSTLPKLKHVWQFALAVKACTDDAAVLALIDRNPKLAADYTAQEAVLEALDAPNPLHEAIASTSGDDEAAMLLIESAPEHVRAEYAADLAVAEYTQDQLCSQYVQLVLGETS
jgi:hypothetical protein